VIVAEAMPIVTKVARRFKEIFCSNRNLARRAVQFIVGISKFEQQFVVAVCEILNHAQKRHWHKVVDWGILFDSAKISPDKSKILFALGMPVELLEFEVGKVAGKLQVSVTWHAENKVFSNERSVVQWMAECDPLAPSMQPRQKR
jgi:hypothetical protein